MHSALAQNRPDDGPLLSLSRISGITHGHLETIEDFLHRMI
jgi:hypothetical protein